jgi:hypothetical protein
MYGCPVYEPRRHLIVALCGLSVTFVRYGWPSRWGEPGSRGPSGGRGFTNLMRDSRDFHGRAPCCESHLRILCGVNSHMGHGVCDSEHMSRCVIVS